MNHVVVDLEMCKVNKRTRREHGYRCNMETIQIGAVMLDEEYNEISSFSVYVRPEYGEIDWVIANLTGIHDSNVKNAPALDDAVRMFLNWVGDREARYYAWSDTDYNQLLNEVVLKDIDDERIMALMDADWCDYQKVFDTRFEMESATGLKLALDLCGIDPDGHAHNGLDDARNTGKLIAMLEQDGEYELPAIFIDARKEEVEPLQYSMASLFDGLKLAQ